MKALGILVLAWSMFIGSFILTAAVQPEHGDFREMRFTGWDAMCFSVVIGMHYTESIEPQAILYYLWPITNLIMLATPLALRSRRKRLRAWLPHVMLLSTVLNGLPPFMQSESHLVFVAGYYLWVASFVVATGALYLMRGMSQSSPDRARE